MSTTVIAVQPAGSPDTPVVPPFHVGADGAVVETDLFVDSPVVVLGFARRFDVQEITVPFDEFWQSPDAAIGMYVVTVSSVTQEVSAFLHPVEGIRVFNVG